MTLRLNMAGGANTLRDLLLSYNHATLALSDVTSVLAQFRNLRPNKRPFKYGNGQIKNLVAMEGTIPVTYKGKLYNIPIIIWLHETHPYNAPMVYIQPTATMNIKPGPHVDASGSVTLPYLKDWKQGQSDLSTLVSVLCMVFGESPPVFAKPKKPASTSAAGPSPQPPYPACEEPFCLNQPTSNQQVDASINSAVEDLLRVHLNDIFSTVKHNSTVGESSNGNKQLDGVNLNTSTNAVQQEVAMLKEAGGTNNSPQPLTLSGQQSDRVKEAETLEEQAVHLQRIAQHLLERAAAIRREC